MRPSFFITSLLVVAIAPLPAVHYPKPFLLRVLQQLCASTPAAFWLRCCDRLTLCGSLVLIRLFGDLDADRKTVAIGRRSLLSVTGDVFFRVVLVSRIMWKQVSRTLPDAGPVAQARVRAAPAGAVS